jgi:uncharacterized protein YutE (UPF0331/DUF86 family)
MQVNRDLLRQRAQEIRYSLAVLGRHGSLSREEFLDKEETIDAAKYRLVIAIEAAISICTHLTARLAQKNPDSYAQCFEILASASIISPGLAERLGRMARLQYMLVNVSWETDDSLVWDILQDNIGDLEEYLLEIGKAIEEAT